LNQGKQARTEHFNGLTYVQSNWTIDAAHSTSAQDNQSRSIDFAWSTKDTTKGGLAFVKQGNTKAASIQIWDNTTQTWSAAASTASQSQTIESIAITGRSTANEFDFCDETTTPNISCYKSDFTPTLTTPTGNAIASTTDAGIQRSFDLGFESLSGNPAIAVYSNATSIPQLKKYDPTTGANGTWDSSATPMTTLTSALQTVRTIPNPENDDIMILLGDGTSPNKIYSQVWDGANNALYATPAGEAFTTHGTNGSADTDYWYDFAWDDN